MRAASELQATSLTPGRGRTCYTIATTIDAAPQCIATLQQATTAYRTSLTIEASDDAAFNLAQALVSLAEMYQDGAGREKGADVRYLQEAATLFSTTEAIQRDAASEGDEESSLVDTLLALVDCLSSLYTADASQRGETWTSLEGALARATAEGDESAAAVARVQANVTVARVEADYTPESPPNASALLSAVDVLERLLGDQVGSSEKAAPLDAFSDLADARFTAADLFLRFSLSTSDVEDATTAKAMALENLKAAFDLYEEMITALTTPLLRSTHGVPSHLIPSTLSATHCQRSRLLLLLSLSSPALLEGALDAAIRAIEACGAGFTYRATEKAFTRAADARTDWTAMKALREAALCLARAGFVDLGVTARLLKSSGAIVEDVKAYVEEEMQGDAIWLSSDGAERTMWERLAAALDAEVQVDRERVGR